VGPLEQHRQTLAVGWPQLVLNWPIAKLHTTSFGMLCLANRWPLSRARALIGRSIGKHWRAKFCACTCMQFLHLFTSKCCKRSPHCSSPKQSLCFPPEINNQISCRFQMRPQGCQSVTFVMTSCVMRSACTLQIVPSWSAHHLSCASIFLDLCVSLLSCSQKHTWFPKRQRNWKQFCQPAS